MRGFNALAIGATLLLFMGLVLYALFDPEGFSRQVAKDGAGGGGGAFEHLTVIVLIPGILSGLCAFWVYRDRLPHPILGYWVPGWSLACVYFAGEEASWGQWYFGWETPGILTGINDQGETNLHNISSWLDQKPRLLVELFILVAGVIVPLWHVIANQQSSERHGLLSAVQSWVCAPSALLPAGLLFVMIRIANWLPDTGFRPLSSSEPREFAIAWFLMLYLLSYAWRLKHLDERSERESVRSDHIQAR